MINLDIDNPERKNKAEHDILEREIDKLKEEVRKLKEMIYALKEAT